MEPIPVFVPWYDVPRKSNWNYLGALVSLMDGSYSLGALNYVIDFQRDGKETKC